jgi:radical SAM protein with 4Fe4S-binding SPASM domain
MAIARLDGDPRKTVRWWEGPAAPPRIVVWEITLRCDLGCRHCGSRAGAARKDELSRAEALDVVAQLAKLGVREVTLIGGEAYLREDWTDIAHAITKAGMVCTMVTGGRGFDALRLQEALAAGVRHVSVSIDGLAATHDTVRGMPGSFEAAVRTARQIAATGAISLGINTQINRLSMPELPALADLLIEIGAQAWQLQLTVPLGRAADRPALLLQPFHLLELFPLLHWIKQEKLDPGGVALVPGNNIGYFGPYEAALRYGGEAGHVWSGCNAGRASLGIEADGKIKGCPSLPSSDYTGGNVRDRPIEEIWRSSAQVRGLSERTVADLWGYCAGCEHAARCKAGCTWTSHALFGRPGNNPYCHHRALDLHQRGLRERLQLVKAAPGHPFDYGRFELITESVNEADEPEGISPVPLSYLARLFDLKPDAGSVWPQTTLRNIVRKNLPPVPSQAVTPPRGRQ